MKKGRVVCSASGSFDGLEKIARQRDAKGCFFDRGVHHQEKKIARWLCRQEEEDYTFGEFSHAQLQVSLASFGCDDGNCQDASCEDDDAQHALAGPNEIRDACAQLVAGLPASFREDVRSDAESLAWMCVRLCPEVPWLTFRLEIVQHDACWRWHQDAYVSRAIISYVGPGTCAADDTCVCWDEFTKAAQEATVTTNEKSVPREFVKQMRNNSVLFMKGNSWPGIRGKGLMHKSPSMQGDEPPKRLLLKVDLHNARPLLADEEDEEDEKEEGKNEDGQVSATEDSRARSLSLKRLATSDGFKSSKAWKSQRGL
mmetsp:Transcript_46247/g.93342  ORF Transcript_46247/g.93342 Transcript_46247/m.93342 type:complete len:313 (-) Transcript_46247:158-1096(-)